jgi:hypothetical protein
MDLAAASTSFLASFVRATSQPFDQNGNVHRRRGFRVLIFYAHRQHCRWRWRTCRSDAKERKCATNRQSEF